MKPIYSTFLFLLAVVIWGCPYESTVAIDKTPSIKINEKLLGAWRKSSYPSDYTEVVFTKKSPYQYAIQARVQGEAGDYDKYNFIAWLSVINNWRLLNVYDKEESKYFFVVVELENNRLSLKPISEDITEKEFNTPAEIKKYFQQLLDKDFYQFDDDTGIGDLQKVK
jgi:hypothetical protein